MMDSLLSWRNSTQLPVRPHQSFIGHINLPRTPETQETSLSHGSTCLSCLRSPLSPTRIVFSGNPNCTTTLKNAAHARLMSQVSRNPCRTIRSPSGGNVWTGDSTCGEIIGRRRVARLGF